MRSQFPEHFSLTEQAAQQIAARTAEILKKGGVIVYPTDTIYGLGADPFSARAVQRVYRLKGRSFSKPSHVLIGSIEMLDLLVEKIPAAAQKLVEIFWPGPLTIILPARKELQGRFLAEDHTLGIRLPTHDFCRQLSLELQGPVLSTSANLSGGANPLKLEDIPEEILRRVDAVVDGGESEKTEPSTIVKIVEKPLLVREGALPLKEIEAVLGPVEKLG